MLRHAHFVSLQAGILGLMSLVVAGAHGAPMADHTTVDASVIPQTALDSARALHMNFSHASVGGNIWGGLTTLSGQSSSRYSFANWAENDRGNPGWQAKVDDFETFVTSNLSSYTVFMNKFCYIDQDANFTYFRDSMVKLAGLYPSKVFVWFTMPLMTSGTDNALRQTFNTSVRSYAGSNNLPLFDLADIESHRANGTAVTEGGNEALATEWSSDGGHLNADGAARAANAVWQLMAQLGGWTNGTASGGQSNVGDAGGPPGTNTGTVTSPGGDSSGCSLAAAAHKNGTTVFGLAAAGLALVAARRRRS
jgi:MYXO-CTERM domain-containing protein